MSTCGRSPQEVVRELSDRRREIAVEACDSKTDPRCTCGPKATRSADREQRRRQRGEVHASRRGRRERVARGAYGAVSRARHGAGHSRVGEANRFRGVSASGLGAIASSRNRARPRDRASPRGDARRIDRSRKRGRARLDVHVLDFRAEAAVNGLNAFARLVVRVVGALLAVDARVRSCFGRSRRVGCLLDRASRPRCRRPRSSSRSR